MAAASHRHYVGFPNYVLTYSLTHLLTYLQNADKVAFASTKLKPQKVNAPLMPEGGEAGVSNDWCISPELRLPMGRDIKSVESY